MTTRETPDRQLENLLKRQFGQLLAPMANPAITDIFDQPGRKRLV